MDLIEKDKQKLKVLNQAISDAFQLALKTINDPDIKSLLQDDERHMNGIINSRLEELENSYSSFSFTSLYLEEIPTDEIDTGNHVAYFTYNTGIMGIGENIPNDEWNKTMEERKEDIIPRLNRLKELLNENGVDYIEDGKHVLYVEINSASKQRLGQALMKKSKNIKGADT